MAGETRSRRDRWVGQSPRYAWASHPRTLEQGTLIIYALERELEALEKVVDGWRVASERRMRRDLIAAERDAREWLARDPDTSDP